jgi:hypothetical protein
VLLSIRDELHFGLQRHTFLLQTLHFLPLFSLRSQRFRSSRCSALGHPELHLMLLALFFLSLQQSGSSKLSLSSFQLQRARISHELLLLQLLRPRLPLRLTLNRSEAVDLFLSLAFLHQSTSRVRTRVEKEEERDGQQTCSLCSSEADATVS